MKKDNISIMCSNLGALSMHPEFGFIERDKTKNLIFSNKPILNEEKWHKWCWFIAYHGCDATRILPYFIWGISNPFDVITPFVYYGEVRKADLNSRLINWQEFLTKMIDIASQYNIKIWLDLFDNCAFHPTKYSKNNPWSNNIQNKEDYFDGIEYAVAFSEFIAEKFKSQLLSGDLCIELCNEMEYRGKKDKAHKFAIEIMKVFKNIGMKPENFSYGAMLDKKEYLGKGNFQYQPFGMLENLKSMKIGGSVWNEKNKDGTINDYGRNQVYRPIHGILDNLKYETLDDGCIFGEFGHMASQGMIQWIGHDISVWFSNDGSKKNHIKHCDRYTLENGKIDIRPLPADMNKFSKSVFLHMGEKQNIIIEIVPKNRKDKNCMATQIKAIVTAYSSVFGEKPKNYQKIKNPIIKEDPVPIEPIEPDPNENIKKEENMKKTKLISFSKKFPFIHIMLFKWMKYWFEKNKKNKIAKNYLALSFMPILEMILYFSTKTIVWPLLMMFAVIVVILYLESK